MLTDEERRAIEAHVVADAPRRGAAIGALAALQAMRGWVSDEDLADVARLLGMAPEELENVATFYDLVHRRPVGRHVILVCDSVSCWLSGHETVLDHLRRRLDIELGGTTPDGLFTLLPVACLGACDHAPALMLNDVLYGDLDEARIDEILAAHSPGAGGASSAGRGAGPERG